MQNLMINSALVPTTNHNQSLALKQTCASGLAIKAVSDISISTFVFASVLRSDPKAKPVMRRVVACNEKDARRQLSAMYVLSLGSRLPVNKVTYA